MLCCICRKESGISTKESKNVFWRKNGLKHLERSGNGKHAGAAHRPQSPRGGDDDGGGGTQRAASNEPQRLHYSTEKNQRKKKVRKLGTMMI
jgi:hypothetical protein